MGGCGAPGSETIWAASNTKGAGHEKRGESRRRVAVIVVTRKAPPQPPQTQSSKRKLAFDEGHGQFSRRCGGHRACAAPRRARLSPRSSDARGRASALALALVVAARGPPRPPGLYSPTPAPVPGAVGATVAALVEKPTPRTPLLRESRPGARASWSWSSGPQPDAVEDLGRHICGAGPGRRASRGLSWPASPSRASNPRAR